MKNGYVKKETEGLITAAQDQALPTRWRKVNIENYLEHLYAECVMREMKQYFTFYVSVLRWLKQIIRRGMIRLAQLVH